MATLQKIRSRGVLIVVAIGLALFAFLVGDAWRTMQPHQVGDAVIIDKEKLSVQDLQRITEDYVEAIKLVRGDAALTEEELAQVRDEAWSNYVNNVLIEKETSKLGLTVTDEEFINILQEGSHPLLRQTPFVNPQTGLFDRDILNNFLVEYESSKNNPSLAGSMAQYDAIHKYWKFVEKRIKENLLANKYQVLIANSILSNPNEAKSSFDARNKQYNLNLVAIPYSAVLDSAITVSDKEIEELYNKRKEEFKQINETRDIKYIDVIVTASAEDKAAIEKEVADATEQLKAGELEYSSILRNAKSTLSYSNLSVSKNVLPADVVARLDSVKSVGQVYGPYYNSTDNTINSFKLVGKEILPDSIEYRLITLQDLDSKKLATLTDSVFNAVKGGANFEDVAKKYGQTGKSIWISASGYEGQRIDNENLKFINLLHKTPAKEVVKSNIGQTSVVLQILSKKANKEKYNLAIVKRPVEFSKQTYNSAYNKFTEFIATNNTMDKINEKAEEAGYKLLERKDLQSIEHTIGGVKGSKEALRWAFQAKEGAVSNIYECGNNDHILAVVVERVNPKGYRRLEDVKDMLVAEIQKNKKAEKIAEMFKANNAQSLEQYKTLSGAISDSLRLVSFNAPAYVSELRSSEPVLSAFASVAKANTISKPLKGNSAVIVASLVSEESQNEEFKQEDEQKSITERNVRIIGRTLLIDLFQKADIEDNRYMFF